MKNIPAGAWIFFGMMAFCVVAGIVAIWSWQPSKQERFDDPVIKPDVTCRELCAPSPVKSFTVNCGFFNCAPVCVCADPPVTR